MRGLLFKDFKLNILPIITSNLLMIFIFLLSILKVQEVKDVSDLPNFAINCFISSFYCIIAIDTLALGASSSDAKYGWNTFLISSGVSRKKLLLSKLIFHGFFVLMYIILSIILTILTNMVFAARNISISNTPLYIGVAGNIFLAIGLCSLIGWLPLVLSPQLTNLFSSLAYIVSGVLSAIPYISLFAAEIYSEQVYSISLFSNIIYLLLSLGIAATFLSIWSIQILKKDIH